MFIRIKSLLSRRPVPAEKLLRQGAQILDLRTAEEFACGHAPGAINVPLQHIDRLAARLDKRKAIVICHRLDLYTTLIVTFLRQLGFRQVADGGHWTTLSRLVSKEQEQKKVKMH